MRFHNDEDMYRWAEWCKPPSWYVNDPPAPMPLSPEQHEAWGRLAQETWPRAVAFATWLANGDYQLAQDAVQEAFLQLLGRAGRYDLTDDRPSTNLVLAYVKYATYGQFRARKGRRMVSLDAPVGKRGKCLRDFQADPSARPPDQRARRNELWDALRPVLIGLSADQLEELRQCLALLPATDLSLMLEEPERLECYARSHRLYRRDRSGKASWLAELEAGPLDTEPHE